MKIIKDFISNRKKNKILVHLKFLDKMSGCYNY